MYTLVDAHPTPQSSSRPTLLHRTHGSALFTRGETQALCVTTLGPKSDALRADNIRDAVEGGGGSQGEKFYLQVCTSQSPAALYPGHRPPTPLLRTSSRPRASARWGVWGRQVRCELTGVNSNSVPCTASDHPRHPDAISTSSYHRSAPPQAAVSWAMASWLNAPWPRSCPPTAPSRTWCASRATSRRATGPAPWPRSAAAAFR